MIVTFSKHLEFLMKQAGMTKAELARAAEVSHVAVGNYLKGRIPKHEQLAKLAAVFGLNPDYLLNPSKYSAPLRTAAERVKRLPARTTETTASYNAMVKTGTDALRQEQDEHEINGARSILKVAREAKGWTQQKFARMLGYSDAGTYIAIEEGRSQMGEKMAIKAAKLLGLDVSDLMDGSDHPIERGAAIGTFGAVPDIHLPPGMTAKYVPLIAMAQCGPNMAWDDGGYTHQGFLAFNPEDPKAFAVTLAGDSMMPRIEPGDVALIYPSQQPKNGKVVLARLNEDKGGDVLVKVYQANGDTITLSSYNHGAYPPMHFHRSDFAWIYPVAKITKDL